MRKNNLCWIDAGVSDVDYSYHCDANGHYSLIDYFVCSAVVMHNVDSKSSILVDGDNTSDHYAVSVFH